MAAIFQHAFSRSRGQILGWGLSLGLLGVYFVSFFDSLTSQQQQITQLLKSFPPQLMAFFGDFGEMFTPSGYLSVEFFSYMPLILGIYAILAGSGLLASDEERGTLDLIMANPISRTAFFIGRMLAFVVALVAIFFIISMNWSSMDISWVEMTRPFISLLAVVLLYGTLALMLSMFLPSRRLAAMVVGLVVVASFFLTSLARVDEHLKTIARFSPLNYYQSGQAISGLNWEWIGLLMIISALSTMLAWWRFKRRDIGLVWRGAGTFYH